MNDVRRLTGPGAGAAKYDILTALTLIGLNGPATGQGSVLRLIAAITARYNWRTDEMVAGQRELARMWAVSERTAKREVKRLTEARLLLLRRPGVRGRVASYRLNLAEIVARSRGHWETVGTDFAERMAAAEPVSAQIVRLDFAAPPGPGAGPEPGPPDGQGGTWRDVRQRLRAADPAAFASWYDRLAYLGRTTSEVRLRAATPFIGRYVETHLGRSLAAAIEAELGPFERLRIESG